MTDQTQTPPVDKWLISEPGGPAGPFWGIVTESGRVIALQIVERQHAQMLLVLGNLLGGDVETIEKVNRYYGDQLVMYRPEESEEKRFDEHYFVTSVSKAISEVSDE